MRAGQVGPCEGDALTGAPTHRAEKGMEHRYALHGDVDLAVEEQVRRELDEIVATPDVHLLIDCSDVTFMDSTGIRLIVTTHLALEDQGRHLLVVNMPPNLRRPFELLGVDHLFRYDRDAIDPELEPSN
jgi:anti-anti-sigma factor